MNNKRVSIIIPIYNGRDFIKKCLDSVMMQTYQNIEVIAIDDGSSDNSLKILREYAADNPSIKVFGKKNQGAASARNDGLKKATGEYVLFVDIDDYMDSDYVEKLVDGIEDNDFLVSGYRRYNSNSLICKKVPKDTKWAAYKFSSTWGKLYRNDFLKQNYIEFPTEYQIGEDIFFTIKALSCTDKIKVLPYAGYNNFMNVNSITNQVNRSKMNRNDKMLDLMQNIVEVTKNSKYIDWDMYIFFFLKTTVLHLMTQRYILNKEEYYEEYRKYFNWLEEISFMYHHSNLKLHWQKGEEGKVNLLCNLFIILRKIKLEKVILWMLQNSKVGQIK